MRGALLGLAPDELGRVELRAVGWKTYEPEASSSPKQIPDFCGTRVGNVVEDNVDALVRERIEDSLKEGSKRDSIHRRLELADDPWLLRIFDCPEGLDRPAPGLGIDERSLTDRRPGADCGSLLAEPDLVLEEDDRAVACGLFFTWPANLEPFLLRVAIRLGEALRRLLAPESHSM